MARVTVWTPLRDAELARRRRDRESYTEIGEAMGLSTSAVKSRIQIAGTPLGDKRGERTRPATSMGSLMKAAERERDPHRRAAIVGKLEARGCTVTWRQTRGRWEIGITTAPRQLSPNRFLDAPSILNWGGSTEEGS